jgi:hypothetical protein
MDFGSPYFAGPPRLRVDTRFDHARKLVPLARILRDSARGQAQMISVAERHFASAEIRHLACVLDDLWLAADSFLAGIDAATEGANDPR